MPPAISGQGGHNRTFAAASVLVNGFCLSEDEAFQVLREDYNPRCEPPWTEKDLLYKTSSAAKANHSKPRGYLLGDTAAPHAQACSPIRAQATQAKCIAIDPTTTIENVLKGFRCTEPDVQKASPVRLSEDWKGDFATMLGALYAPGELVNYVVHFDVTDDGKARPWGWGKTRERDSLIAWVRKNGVPPSEAGGWLRMNPVDGRGVADSNVTSLRFALIECDGVPLELQLSLFARLSLPIAAILTSGGRSLHAWVKVDATSHKEYEATTKAMLRQLAEFGVDRKNANPSRLSRLPGALRRIGASGDGRQRLLYLNPNPTGKGVL